MTAFWYILSRSSAGDVSFRSKKDGDNILARGDLPPAGCGDLTLLLKTLLGDIIFIAATLSTNDLVIDDAFIGDFIESNMLTASSIIP